MKVLQINTVYGEGSTGKIAKDIHDLCVAEGIECVCGSRTGGKYADSVEISGSFDSRVHGFLARFTMLKGCFSYFKTRSFLKKVKKYKPDIIHLHNLHGSYVNIGMLMRYIKKYGIPVVFTLHDCWAFTAICPHFTVASCNKWQSGCGACPQRKKYSSCPVDISGTVWKKKKKWFVGVEDMVIVTPSAWLGGLVKQSFLGSYPVQTIYNGIDLNVFAPTLSDFRARHRLEDKKIVLAVAYGWGYGKGLDVVIKLAKSLPTDYKIVLVGTDDEVDKQLPQSVLSVHKTNNQKELAEIYTAADVLINPTREEVLGLVNVEALACGTPVISFNAGGSPECLDGSCGTVVSVGDVDAMEREIVRICTLHPYTSEDCIKRAKLFDKNERLYEYIKLYKGKSL